MIALRLCHIILASKDEYEYMKHALFNVKHGSMSRANCYLNFNESVRGF